MGCDTLMSGFLSGSAGMSLHLPALRRSAPRDLGTWQVLMPGVRAARATTPSTRPRATVSTRDRDGSRLSLARDACGDRLRVAGRLRGVTMSLQTPLDAPVRRAMITISG